MNKRVGDILLEQGSVTSAQLQEAVEMQREKGGRLLWILGSLGYITKLEIFSTLAVHYGLEFKLLSDAECRKVDWTLSKGMTSEQVLQLQSLPVSADAQEVVLYTAYPEQKNILDFYSGMFTGKSLRQVVITDLDLVKLVTSHFQDTFQNQAVYGQYHRNPKESARNVFSGAQVIAASLFCMLLLLLVHQTPLAMSRTVLLLINAFYLLTILFRLALSIEGARSEVLQPVTDEEVRALDDLSLPVYTVLIPVFKEPEVMPHLVKGLAQLDYPPNKLDVLLLLEESDPVTMSAAKAAKPPANWRFIIVPDIHPKTKPKACNYGLHFARGEYLTIYDAEDIPEPDQLKKAVVAFRKHPPGRYLCFQAALNYFNARQNIITKFFTLEYTYWFDYLLPGLDKLRLPIPLGGTSNHFDLKLLRNLGAWDPFNTTEDADLGIRAAAEGYRVGVINSTTFEEANSRYGNWVRQRSRWIKGYMQTALVFNREPIRLLRKVGLKNWFAFQLFIAGTPLLFLINPIMWSFFLFWVVTRTHFMEAHYLPLTTFFSLINLLLGNFLGIYLNCMAVFRRRYYYLLPFALLNPIYWLFFHTPAAYKALWQLFVKPHYWEKTTHGFSAPPPNTAP